MGCQVELLTLEASRKQAEELGLPAPLAELNIFRLLLRRPLVAKALSDLLMSLLFRGKLNDRLRELVIMRIGWATGSDYEWTQHWRIAQDTFGCSKAELLALRDWRSSDLFAEPDRAVLTATDETLETGTVSPETWRLCLEHVGDEEECIELVTAIGAWRLISQLTRSLEIPLEEGVDSWPPDGRAAPASKQEVRR